MPRPDRSFEAERKAQWEQRGLNCYSFGTGSREVIGRNPGQLMTPPAPAFGLYSVTAGANSSQKWNETTLRSSLLKDGWKEILAHSFDPKAEHLILAEARQDDQGRPDYHITAIMGDGTLVEKPGDFLLQKAERTAEEIMASAGFAGTYRMKSTGLTYHR